MIHFKEHEFKGSFDLLSDELKIKLDFLRELCECEIKLSNSSGGFARRMGESWSQHNVTRWGELRAVDGYIPDDMTYAEFYDQCRAAQFTGIGLYHGWPSGERGFHVDVRDGREPVAPARWGAEWIDEGEGKNRYIGLVEFMVKYK